MTAAELRTRWQERPRGRVARLASGRWARLPGPLKLLAVVVLFFVLAVLVPTTPVASVMAPQSDWRTILFNPIGIYVLLAVGLNIVVGQAGMLDLGYVAFYAVGGYSLALLATKQHWNFWFILPVAVVLAAFAGVLLGAPTLRLRGDYLAIVTLGFGQIISVAANNFTFDGGPQGISNIPHPPSIGKVKVFTYGVSDARPYYYLVLVAIFLVIFGVRRLERSRIGRGWAAIREDEDVAELMGVPTYRFRLWAFSAGAAIGGLAGLLYAAKPTFINPDNFTYSLSIIVLAAVVLGGSGNLAGVIVGAFLVAWLPERFRAFADYRIMIFGGALVLMMILRPEGILPSRRRRAEMADTAGSGMNAALLAPAVEGDQ